LGSLLARVTDAATMNLMTGLTDVLAVGLLVLAIFGATKLGKYTNKHAGDPISRRSAELSVAAWSVGLAIPLVSLAYIGWGFVHPGFTAMALLAGADFYLSRGRTLIELLRRRKEWR
jgi:hypothetical protein